MIYVSSIAALINLPYFGSYACTKTFDHRFANAVRMACKRSSVFGDLLYVQTLHPATVVTNLNNFNSDYIHVLTN